ncbi:uncharacterized protein YecT (DUF1311 family) [Rhizobium skierniewicense]|uniref:Uncharacterized protein YecT (DUF1311 family) n=1 Tax=Rhizobium skierniewicense TaxID=984260 RepID=A0A7W6G1Q0_9HYPH|nr:lysozyme inhibitor LprI family protein [Rhizobium skierniewicense]MBB3945950.1 uncharacterized protein YecT (DUF1311 family) [Rhizobium skierniewicense]
MIAQSLRSAPLSLLLACAAFLSGTLAFEARAQDEPNCAEPSTQSDMNACADLDYEKADKDLNAAYQQVRKKMSDWDKSAEDDTKGAVDALVVAQRAWVSFRDANCESFGFQARGGSMEPMLVSSCLADMSTKRAEDLRALSDGF